MADNVAAWNTFIREWASLPTSTLFDAGDRLTELTGVDVEGFPCAESLHPDDRHRNCLRWNEDWTERKIAEITEHLPEVDLDELLLGKVKPQSKCLLVIESNGTGFEMHIYELPNGIWPGIQ